MVMNQYALAAFVDCGKHAQLDMISFILEDPSALGLAPVTPMPREVKFVVATKLAANDHIRYVILKMVLKGACESGNVETARLVEQSLARYLPQFNLQSLMDDNMALEAISAGNGEFLRLLQVNPPIDMSVNPRLAARAGRLDMAQWVVERLGPIMEKRLLRYSIEYGHVDVVKYLHQEMDIHEDQEMEIALRGASLEMIRYLHQVERQSLYTVTPHPITEYTIEVVEYLLDNQTPQVPYTIQPLLVFDSPGKATSLNNQRGPRWVVSLFNLDIPLSSEFLVYIVYNGNVADLEVIRTTMPTFTQHIDIQVILCAMNHGKLDQLKWLLAHHPDLASIQAEIFNGVRLKKVTRSADPEVLLFVAQERLRVSPGHIEYFNYRRAIKQPTHHALHALSQVDTQWFHLNGTNLLMTASEIGSRRVLLYLHGIKSLSSSSYGINNAVSAYQSGGLSSLIYFVEKYKLKIRDIAAKLHIDLLSLSKANPLQPADGYFKYKLKQL
eukprot:gene12968-15242_t